MGGHKVRGHRIAHRLDGDRLYVSISKNGRAVSDRSALAEAQKRFPLIRWASCACVDHRALVISEKLTENEIIALREE